MKAYIAILTLAIILVSCGKTDSDSKAAPIEQQETTASQSAVTSASETEAPAEEKTVTETETETKPAPVTTTTPPEIKAPETYDDMLATVDLDSSFETENGAVTFAERLNAGFANVTGNGRAFCLIPESSGAGQLFFASYYTVNGGGSWQKGDPVSMFRGRLQGFAVEDGRAVVVDFPTASGEPLPMAYILSLVERDEGFSVSCTPDEEYFRTFKDFNDGKRCDVSVRYDGSLNLMIEIKDSESKELQYSGLTALDPDTLEPDLVGDAAE